MSHSLTTSEVSLYAKLIFGERASLKPARGTPAPQADGGRAHVSLSGDEPVDDSVAALHDGRTE